MTSVPGAAPQPVGSGDGADALRRAVEVMDRLRSPGGCAWDAAQTHRSLTRYLLEETYEVVEAIETGDAALLREELGDLLLQVLFHARIASESSVEPFDIDAVAGDLADKLVRRHPHVFAGAEGGDADQLNESWERQKIEEKGRTSALDGVPVNQPALALAAKLVSRARRGGLDVDAMLSDRSLADGTPSEPEVEIGERLLALVGEAVAVGVDPETALRGRARRLREQIVSAERQGRPRT